jgi:hypothetical protein
MVSPFAVYHSNGRDRDLQEPCHWNGGVALMQIFTGHGAPIAHIHTTL